MVNQVASYAREFAKAVLHIIPKLRDLDAKAYYTNEGVCPWYDFAPVSGDGLRLILFPGKYR